MTKSNVLVFSLLFLLFIPLKHTQYSSNLKKSILAYTKICLVAGNYQFEKNFSILVPAAFGIAVMPVLFITHAAAWLFDLGLIGFACRNKFL